MTKRFCDICGGAATADLTVLGRVKVGEPYRATKIRSGDISCVEGVHQRMMHITVEFLDTNKADGSDRQPDLCKGCAADLISEVAQKLRNS